MPMPHALHAGRGQIATDFMQVSKLNMIGCWVEDSFLPTGVDLFTGIIYHP